jgi:hypothetical protein
MKTTVPNTQILTTLIRNEIDRFIDAARVRSECDVDTRRRAMRRYHRSWPLLVGKAGTSEEVSAALHNASPDGIGFLCNHEFQLDSLVLIKLFWHEDTGVRVPAVVRHVTPHHDATLVGCQFSPEDEAACRAALEAQLWYG